LGALALVLNKFQCCRWALAINNKAYNNVLLKRCWRCCWMARAILVGSGAEDVQLKVASSQRDCK
jgi:hypothetical protein